MGTAITTITYNISGASSATVIPPTAAIVDGLPSGVSYSFDIGTRVLSISGIPNTPDITTTVYTYTLLTADVDSGCATATISGTITVDPLAGGTINSGNNQVFCQDPSDASIVPTALSVSGDTAAGIGIEYQWQSSPDNTPGSYVDITGEKSATYSVPSISTTTYYRRMIQRVSGIPSVVQCELPSSVHKITVHSIDVGQIGMPTQICYGTVPEPLVSVKDATSTNGTISYQWQYSPDNNVWTDIANATSNSFTPPGALIATSYYLSLIHISEPTRPY